MENQKINITPTEDCKELIIRTGSAEPVVGFRKGVSINGNLSVPRIHLENPSKWLVQVYKDELQSLVEAKERNDNVLAYSYLKVNRDKGSIQFVEDAGSEWENNYTGVLEMHPSFEKFAINTGNSLTTFELSNFIKMNRSFFETKDKAMLLVSVLRNFKAKIDKEVEHADDARGNKKILIAQAVESNIPESFKIVVPVFKGYEPQTLEVEISINATDLSCSLISPEVNDYIETTKDSLIDEELDKIKTLHPTLRIFEI